MASQRVSGREHVIDPTRIHHVWDNSLEPTLTIASGDVVHFDIPVAGADGIDESSTIETARFDFDTIYNLLGPVWVDGAEPGDTLEIEILSLEPGEWGWTAFLSGMGLLADDFPDPYLKIWNLRGGERAELVPGVSVPIAPFLGTMGTHPDRPGRHLPFPPHEGGGNMDTRHLVAGSTLWLPVHCRGGLFSCGDPHAAQGDGEVCVSAIECPMRTSLRFTLQQRTISTPRFRSSGALTPSSDERGYIATMGIAPDLMEGARSAVRAMVELLHEEHDLSPQDAYVLCSAAGDLKILEVVDAGVWNVGMTMPLTVFAR